MKIVICTVNYCIPLTLAQFKKLDKKSYLDDVYPMLKDAGAENIEYSGHFGSNIFFTARPEDTENILAAVKNLVK